MVCIGGNPEEAAQILGHKVLLFGEQGFIELFPFSMFRLIDTPAQSCSDIPYSFRQTMRFTMVVQLWMILKTLVLTFSSA